MDLSLSYLQASSFSVGAFPLREKCPTIAVTFFLRLQSSHWSLHILETILKPPKAKANLVQRVRLSFFTFSRKHSKPDVPKGSPRWNFSALFDFFSKIFHCPQRVPPSSFLIFCNGMYNKSRRVPLLHFSALCDFFGRKKISKISSFFQKKCFALFEP